MKSLCAIQNPGLGAYTVQPMPDDYQETQAWYDMNAARQQKAIDDKYAADEAAYNAKMAQEAADAAAASVAGTGTVTQTPEDILETARKYQFLARTRPGFDFGINADRRNALFARDSGLGFDLMSAITSSLKANAPQAFKGVKGGAVFASIVPNAGGPRAPKVQLPSWIPRISLPKPLQDAARAAGNLAITTAKDVAAKKKAAASAASASGVAVQTSGYPGGEARNNSLLWIGGGAAVLVAALALSRKK